RRWYAGEASLRRGLRDAEQSMAKLSGPRHFFALDRRGAILGKVHRPGCQQADRQDAIKKQSHRSGDTPFRRPRLHGNTGPLTGEHDAEHHKNQIAPDVDEQLSGSDKVGAEQEENARDSSKSE